MGTKKDSFPERIVLELLVDLYKSFRLEEDYKQVPMLLQILFRLALHILRRGHIH